MIFEEITNKNFERAVKIQNDIFPLENGSQDLRDSIDGTIPKYQFLQKYWLVNVKGEYIGICGLYAYNDYPKDAWLGWFGVVENQRRKGYGTQILQKVFEMASSLGFENLRLYTDEEGNAIAVKLYKKLGMTSEVYDNPDDVHFEIGRTLILSKSLMGNKVSLWNNKNIYLGVHDKRNNII